MKTEATPSSVKERGKFEIILSKIGSWISRPENLVLLILAVLLSLPVTTRKDFRLPTGRTY